MYPFNNIELTVNQEIFTNDLFGKMGEPIGNAKFNPTKIRSKLYTRSRYTTFFSVPHLNLGAILKSFD